MAHFHTTENGNIPFTPEEEAQWDAEHAEWLAGAVARKNAEAERNRQAAYIAEADPLFFKAQRGEATMEEWQAKVAEIKTRFPYQE
jgi:precorrin-2 methylase